MDFDLQACLEVPTTTPTARPHHGIELSHETEIAPSMGKDQCRSQFKFVQYQTQCHMIGTQASASAAHTLDDYHCVQGLS